MALTSATRNTLTIAVIRVTLTRFRQVPGGAMANDLWNLRVKPRLSSLEPLARDLGSGACTARIFRYYGFSTLQCGRPYAIDQFDAELGQGVNRLTIVQKTSKLRDRIATNGELVSEVTHGSGVVYRRIVLKRIFRGYGLSVFDKPLRVARNAKRHFQDRPIAQYADRCFTPDETTRRGLWIATFTGRPRVCNFLLNLPLAVCTSDCTSGPS